MEPVITWLLLGAPWAEYNTRRWLLKQPEEQVEVSASRQAMLAHPQVRQIMADVMDWPSPVLKSHKDAGHPLHKLSFLVDMGIKATDPGMQIVVKRIQEQASAEGPFTVLSNYPTHFGGSGKDELLWALCDAPLLVYALANLGLADHPVVIRAVEYLLGLVRANGFPCAVSPQLGKFRGPGRKDDPCPYANLVMLKALAALPQYHDHPAAHIAVETLLNLWQHSRERSPYLFHMGNDFRKLKAPLVWYDVLHVLDVLSRFSWLNADPRLAEMAALVKSKALDGRYIPESVWTAWKGWDFGQKKEPSAWLTFLVLRATGISDK